MKESKRKQKLNESILEDKLEKVYDVLDGFNIKYYDNVETSHHEQDGEEWYDYLGVFEFDEEIEEKMMNRIIKEIEKSLKYSEVYPTDGDEGYQGFTITLGAGDEDDLFESKKSKAKNKKVNENIHDIEHLVLFPEDLTDDEEYSRMVLLGSIGDISELTDSMGDIYITSMKEVPEDKNEPYNSKARVTITFEGDDVNKENLEKVIEFINSETAFEMAQIEGENKISFDFDPKYV